MLYYGAMSNKIDVEYKKLLKNLRLEILNIKQLADSK